MNSADSAELPEFVSLLQARQYAYFVYRSLDCFSHLVTGVSRDPVPFETTSRIYARTINLLLRHGHNLPSFEDVLPSTEAVCSLMFHVALCDRNIFWAALEEACETMFGDVRRAAATTGALEPELAAFVNAFERALEERGQAASADGEGRLCQIRIQIRELAGRHNVLLNEPAAPN